MQYIYFIYMYVYIFFNWSRSPVTMAIRCLFFVCRGGIYRLLNRCVFGLAYFLVGTRRYLPCPGGGRRHLFSGHQDLPGEKCHPVVEDRTRTALCRIRRVRPLGHLVPLKYFCDFNLTLIFFKFNFLTLIFFIYIVF